MAAPLLGLCYANRCSKTAFIEMLFFVWCTLIAQIILTMRIYAITTKNVIVTGVFVCITITQFAFGIYVTSVTARVPAQPLPPIHLMAYQLCVFTTHPKLGLAFTAISLLYDSLTFLAIVVHAVRSGFENVKMSRILRTIVQDTTIYFMVIFTYHFVLWMTLLLERPILQLLPGAGIVYLPIMIGRLMLSLKKAADPSKPEWSLATITFTNPGGYISGRSRIHFAPRSDRGSELAVDGDIPLGVVPSPVP